MLEKAIQVGGVEACSNSARNMTEMGACWRNRSKISPSRMAAVPGCVSYPQKRQQVINKSTTLEGVGAPLRALADPRRAACCLPRQAPFHDLGPLVLGDHPLDLDQEVLGGVMTEGVAEEGHLDAAPGELLEDQDLVGIFV